VDSVPIPIWSIGVLLIIIGPFAVQRLADLWAAVVERRTDDALSAMTARTQGASMNVDDGDAAVDARKGAETVTQQDSARSRDEP
jgi:hypothetical protein